MIYDVIVIGGGPAGSSAATYLRQKNLNVLVLEKEKFPRDHVGESLIPFCYYKLKELDALEEVKKFATLKPGVNFVDNAGENESIWCFKHVISDEAHMSYHTLRAPFDDALLRNAEKKGAKVLEEHTVKHVTLDAPDNLVHVETEDNSKGKHEFSAKFLLDASGQGTFLSRKLGTKKPFEGLDRTAFFCHWINNTYDQPLNEGLIKIIYLGGQKKGWIWVIPVGPNHLSIGVSLNNDYVKEKKKLFSEVDAKDWKKLLYLNEIKEAKALDSILQNAKLEHEVLVIGDYSYYNEKKFGKNYALIGDAGAFLDPIFSSGIYVAFESANMVTKAIETGLKNPAEMEKALTASYETIDGAYVLLEKFIRLFYEPETFNFANVEFSADVEFSGFKSAYDVLHYLLAGDFFTKHKEYSAFIDELKTEKSFKRFMHLTKSSKNTLNDREACNYSFEEIYGHLMEKK